MSLIIEYYRYDSNRLSILVETEMENREIEMHLIFYENLDN